MASRQMRARSAAKPAAARVVGEVAFRPVNILRRSGRELRTVMRAFVPLVATVVSVALGSVWLRQSVIETGYRLSTVRQVIDRLEQERRELDLEVAAAESPARLEEIGHSLGLAPPQWGEEVSLP